MQLKEFFKSNLMHIILISCFCLLGWQQVFQSFELLSLSEHLSAHHHHIHVHQTQTQTRLQMHHEHDNEHDNDPVSDHPEQMVTEAPDLWLPLSLSLMFLGLLFYFLLFIPYRFPFKTRLKSLYALSARPPPQLRVSPILLQLKTVILLH